MHIDEAYKQVVSIFIILCSFYNYKDVLRHIYFSCIIILYLDHKIRTNRKQITSTYYLNLSILEGLK